METPKTNNSPLYMLGALIFLFLIGRIWGGSIFDNGWSFNHWQFLPLWYLITWAISFGLVATLVLRFQTEIGLFFSRKGPVIGGLAALLSLLVLFGFDSTLYGGGNIRMAQITQADQVIFRWFEFGSAILMSLLNQIFLPFFDNFNFAGVFAFRVYAYLAAAASLAAAYRLAKKLTANREGQGFNRVAYFVILFFGPQALTQFGLISFETMLVPICLWFACLAFESLEGSSHKALAYLWGITLLGMFMHISMAALLPAALFVTLYHLTGQNKKALPLILSLITYAVLVALLFKWGSSSLEYRTFFLFPEGRLPNNDYGLFSLRHLGDLVQIMFLAAPLIMAVKWSALDRMRERFFDPLVLTSWLLTLGTFTYLFVSDPRQSIVLDFPRLAAYLAPASFFAVALIRSGGGRVEKVRGYLPLLATASIFILLAYLPSYTRIELSEPHVDAYMVDHESYYHDGCLAYRDAHFLRGEYTLADKWERRLILRSDDYLNLRGTGDLAHADRSSEAIRVLYQMIALNPYWTSPRAKLASIQLEAGRPQLAKPQIDTALMIEPYNRIHLVHQYVYYRTARKLPQALEAIETALEFFPNDLEIRSDQMLMEYGLGKYPRADSLAKELQSLNDTIPFPYLVLGLVANRSGSHQRAISNFKRFIELAPNEPEVPMIQARLDSLTALIGGQ